MRLKVTNNTDR